MYRPEHLQRPGLGLVVEDHGLLVEYGSRAGGLTAESKKRHIGGSVDHYLVAHHRGANDDGQSGFTWNKEVTPQNFADRAMATASVVDASIDLTRRTASPLMSDVPYKGTHRAFHDNVARFAIQR